MNDPRVCVTCGASLGRRYGISPSECVACQKGTSHEKYDDKWNWALGRAPWDETFPKAQRGQTREEVEEQTRRLIAAKRQKGVA